MTTQADADNLAQQIVEFCRDATDEQIDDAFGRLARGVWMASYLQRVTPWEQMTPGAREPWILAAKAVRMAEQELQR